MIDMRLRPPHLPQISAPFNIIIEKLDEEGIGYSFADVDPNDLEPSQGITFSDHVSNVDLDDNNPIWVANNNKIIDGHHRWNKALDNNKKIKIIKIDLHDKDACRVLNKIQDIYEYEENLNLEEITSLHRTINQENNIDSDGDNTIDDEFLSSLEEDNASIEYEKPNKNPKKLIVYRKEPIKENSIIGNFFMIEPIKGYHKYEVEFDNLLDTNELGLTYKDTQNPIDIVGRMWFPNINFEKLSTEYNTTPINLKTKAIAEKANKLGYDGIKYGDKIIQGLK